MYIICLLICKIEPCNTAKIVTMLSYASMSDEQRRLHEEHSQSCAKWKNDFDLGVLSEGLIANRNKRQKPRMVVITENGPVIMEPCVSCNIQKPISTLYFQPNRNTHEENLKMPSGKEWISNSKSYPCKECNTGLIHVRYLDPEQLVKRMLHQYPKLNMAWFESTMKTTSGMCPILNIQMSIMQGTDFQISIQNNRNDIKEHLPEHCMLMCRELNIPEHNIGISLTEAWIMLFTGVKLLLSTPDTPEIIESRQAEWRKRYKMTAKESGVDVSQRLIDAHGKMTLRNPEYGYQRTKKELKRQLQRMAEGSNSADIKAYIKNKRPNICIALDADMIFSQGEKQGWRCYYSGVLLSWLCDDWNRFSVERLDNTKNHTADNIVLICRILNVTPSKGKHINPEDGVGQWSKKKILFAFTSQKLVPISEEIRDKAGVLAQRT